MFRCAVFLLAVILKGCNSGSPLFPLFRTETSARPLRKQKREMLSKKPLSMTTFLFLSGLDAEQKLLSMTFIFYLPLPCCCCCRCRVVAVVVAVSLLCRCCVVAVSLLCRCRVVAVCCCRWKVAIAGRQKVFQTEKIFCMFERSEFTKNPVWNCFL